jgi:hypothetical protein
MANTGLLPQTSPSASPATVSFPASQSPSSASGTVNHFGKCAPEGNVFLFPQNLYLLLSVQGRLIFSRFLLTHSSHSIRYVMKNRATDEPLFVVVITLKPKEGEGEKATDGEKKKEANESEDLD